MKIGVSQQYQTVRLYWETVFEEVHARAFAKSYHIPVFIHEKKPCLTLRAPDDMLLLLLFLRSGATLEAYADGVFEGINHCLYGAQEEKYAPPLH